LVTLGSPTLGINKQILCGHAGTHCVAMPTLFAAMQKVNCEFDSKPAASAESWNACH